MQNGSGRRRPSTIPKPAASAPEPSAMRAPADVAAVRSFAQISLYVVGSRPNRAVPHVARSPERITGQLNRD
jgi:hypothetical protein